MSCVRLSAGFPGKAKFNRCRFGRSSRSSKANGNNTDDIVLYTQINSRTSNKSCVCYLAVYGPPAEGLTSGKPWQCLKSAVAHSQHLGSCMDISKYGEWIAYGFSEGGLRVSSSGPFLDCKALYKIFIFRLTMSLVSGRLG